MELFKNILAKALSNIVGKVVVVVLLLGLPGIFTYIVPCKPCYNATMAVGGMLDTALNKAANTVTETTGVVTPAETNASAEPSSGK